MYTLMDGESRALDELLSTVWIIANMGSDTAVNTLWKLIRQDPGK
jgi:hypothetical protein